MSVGGLVGFAIGFLLVRVVRHFEVKRIRQENIRQLKGEIYYPCKPDIFEATYEPVEPGGEGEG